MTLKRRDFLLFLGGSAGAVALTSLQSCGPNTPTQAPSPAAQKFGFRPIKGPMPVTTDGISPAQQLEAYKTYEVADDLVLPEGFAYQVIAAWGDKVGNSRFGYNNDYLSFVETGPDEGYLTVNFEYISDIPWRQTFQQVIGKSLPFEEVDDAVKKAGGKKGLNAFALPDKDPIKAKILEICKEALTDQGLGVISLRRKADGSWERTNSPADRRITGISGLEDGKYLKATGPAVAIFQKTQGQGYIDGLGDRIIGTLANCAGGTTPWGTVLSGEENFQAQVAEPVYADGTAADPGELTFSSTSIDGQGNVFGLAGNKYGWIVELDPANSDDYGTKHTWLGRYRHEAVGVRVEAGKPLAFYSGCDRMGGHVYKFVSSESVGDPQDKANSNLLTNGMLYAAKFKSDGTGTWIPLKADTPVNPDSPSNIIGQMIPLPYKAEQGAPLSYLEAKKDEQIKQFKQKYKTLGDLYTGTPQEKQGAILIDAHYAANAAGATSTARPEDTEIAPDGSLFISFTAGLSGKEGGPDKRIFKGPHGETPYPYGWIVRLQEVENDPAAMSFRWKILATGGEPAAGGLGFANPDNLLIDRSGNLWMVTDMGTGGHNKAVESRVDAEGKPVKLSKLMGAFGNNSIWYIPTSGENAGNAYLFGCAPMECETTGPFFTSDQKTLFLSVQHPGEAMGIRKDMAADMREFAMLSADGKEFVQSRKVPVGSNWPGKGANDPPKPAVVAIRRLDSGEIA
ncbi:PhoX family protein [Kamptonema formosum]|uniref:PhoX family protein n=1 Tax=Kamptonema formosum TaxID=331992 RepID=UPI00034B10F2|nr:alkaline phosphatase PhoX [Oscillatoria sp. PCC 10802]